MKNIRDFMTVVMGAAAMGYTMCETISDSFEWAIAGAAVCMTIMGVWWFRVQKDAGTW